MAAPTQYAFTYQDVVRLLIRETGLTEGEWALQLHFGLQGSTVGQSDQDLTPCALVGVRQIGIVKVDKPSNLSVDARKVRGSGAKPAATPRAKRKKKATST